MSDMSPAQRSYINHLAKKCGHRDAIDAWDKAYGHIENRKDSWPNNISKRQASDFIARLQAEALQKQAAAELEARLKAERARGMER